MSLRIDPARNEVKALKQATEWRGRRVLEIGCGDGRLTRRIARLGSQIDAIDPNESLVRKAELGLPRSLKPLVRFDVGASSRLPYRNKTFDLVLFSWSL